MTALPAPLMEFEDDHGTTASPPGFFAAVIPVPAGTPGPFLSHRGRDGHDAAIPRRGPFRGPGRMAGAMGRMAEPGDHGASRLCAPLRAAPGPRPGRDGADAGRRHPL